MRPNDHAGGARLRGRSRKPRDLGYPHELWTTRLLADHARENGPAQGHPSLSTLVQGTLCKILNAHPREVIGFLERLDRAYALRTAMTIILDNHAAHISKETKAWLDEQPEERFTFVFTPKHGSRLNIIEGFFSKLARSVLRGIRVGSKQELARRIIAAIEQSNANPVVHT